MNLKNINIGIIGLGYVGLPLAVEFSKKYNVFGFDINEKRINDLKLMFDTTNELSQDDLKQLKNLNITNQSDKIKHCNIYIITVPTPVNNHNKPDLAPLLNATKTVAEILKIGDIIIYESTVYPGCTEEECVPLIEKISNLKFNIDFFCGYSPERINPGDKINTLTKIKKVTSGSTKEIAIFIDNLYSSIIVAGTYLAPSIKVAEASKAIENAQRDVNISFINELAIIFDKIGIDTNDVIEAASTKWNFLKFTPGLVGGHCIGVDPYYLAYKSEMLGYQPNVILSGRKVNDYMAFFIANKVLKLMSSKNIILNKSNVLILGFSFKENCPDFRNTKVIDVYNELTSFGVHVDIYDPVVNEEDVFNNFNIRLISNFNLRKYNAIILAVKHDLFNNIDFNIFKKGGAIIYDTKSFISRELVDARL
jgi:UDP-N-acetyl-D-galactosamine dehydrogenase